MAIKSNISPHGDQYKFAMNRYTLTLSANNENGAYFAQTSKLFLASSFVQTHCFFTY